MKPRVKVEGEGKEKVPTTPPKKKGTPTKVKAPAGGTLKEGEGAEGTVKKPPSKRSPIIPPLV